MLKKPIVEPIYSKSEEQLCWSCFKDINPELMFDMFRKQSGVFDFMRIMGSRSAAFSKYMKGATFIIPSPRLLAQVIEMLSSVEMSDRDTKGDMFEYLLG